MFFFIPAQGTVEDLCSNVNQQVLKMRNRKHGLVSCLMTKGFDELRSFNWDLVVDEMVNLFPKFTQVCLNVLLPLEDRTNPIKLKSVKPRLGMVYSILLQGRVRELSLVQRLISLILLDHIRDEKVK